MLPTVDPIDRVSVIHEAARGAPEGEEVDGTEELRRTVPDRAEPSATPPGRSVTLYSAHPMVTLHPIRVLEGLPVPLALGWKPAVELLSRVGGAAGVRIAVRRGEGESGLLLKIYNAHAFLGALRRLVEADPSDPALGALSQHAAGWLWYVDESDALTLRLD